MLLWGLWRADCRPVGVARRLRKETPRAPHPLQR